MASRRGARRRALEILYQSDLNGSSPSASLDDGADEFTVELVRGAEEHLAELDELIGTHSREWQVSRMPAVDRAVLRLACYELRYMEDIPPAAAINEAVEAAKELSTEDSARFVNGILGQIARESPDG